MKTSLKKTLFIPLYPFSPVIRMVRNKMDFLRTYRLKLIIAKVLRIIRIFNGSASSVQFPDTFCPCSNHTNTKKIGVIDHSYHYKTGSTTFIIDLLKQLGSVKVMWDNQWNGGKFRSIHEVNREGFDILIIWQIMYYHNPEMLKKLNCKNIIIIPMYDDIHTDPDKLFLRFKDFRFISFCKKLQERFNHLGINSRYFQFYIDPSSLPFQEDIMNPGASTGPGFPGKLQGIYREGINGMSPGVSTGPGFPGKLLGTSPGGLKGFFWQRTNDITWDHIRILIENSGFSDFHLHLALDPIWYREVLPTNEEMKKYNIKITRWFDKKEEYLSVLSRANVFFTPRFYEGIGMPVIEAMTMGKVVVAPDHPTINEYIIHGRNGLLYDIHDLKPLDFTSVRTIANQARKDCLSGFENWQQVKTNMLEWISTGK